VAAKFASKSSTSLPRQKRVASYVAVKAASAGSRKSAVLQTQIEERDFHEANFLTSDFDQAVEVGRLGGEPDRNTNFFHGFRGLRTDATGDRGETAFFPSLSAAA
jgi:hypothetical protein